MPTVVVVVQSGFQLVIHPHIHAHLADVLMAKFAGFHVKQHKTLEQLVVKHQVNVEVLSLGADAMLPRHKCKALAQFPMCCGID